MAISPVELGQLLAVFEEHFRTGEELGASVSVWWQGEEWLNEGRGWCEREERRAWTSETLVPVYSATKGPAVATAMLALERHGLGLDDPVREVWSGFPLQEATFGDLFSHQCGLAVLDRRVDIRDHAEVVAAIEAQQPAWRPGNGHGYHPRTFGALLDEPVRRLTGETLGHYWRDEMARPAGIDFWIGLPQAEHARVAVLYPGRPQDGMENDAFYREFNRAGSLTQRAFASPGGLRSVREMNDPAAWSAGFPALGGVGTAAGLAKFYQLMLGHVDGPLSRAAREAMIARRVDGEDLILQQPTAFGAGFQLDPLDATGQKIRRLYGASDMGFGHPGAGGSHGFADPSTGVSFAYVMNQMELSVMPGRRCQRLIDALMGA